MSSCFYFFSLFIPSGEFSLLKTLNENQFKIGHSFPTIGKSSAYLSFRTMVITLAHNTSVAKWKNHGWLINQSIIISFLYYFIKHDRYTPPDHKPYDFIHMFGKKTIVHYGSFLIGLSHFLLCFKSSDSISAPRFPKKLPAVVVIKAQAPVCIYINKKKKKKKTLFFISFIHSQPSCGCA